MSMRIVTLTSAVALMAALAGAANAADIEIGSAGPLQIRKLCSAIPG